jgi:hypothetical protein
MKKSEETKRKMSLAKLGIPKSKKTRARMSKSHLGKTHSEETKKKISETMKKRKSSITIIDPWSTS